MITDNKWQQLRDKMEALGINEKDLEEKFILPSGKGGQKVQTSKSCVYLKYTLKALEVKCQRSRYREDNRFFARRILCEKLERLASGCVSKEAQKIRKQKKRRRRRTKIEIEGD